MFNFDRFYFDIKFATNKDICKIKIILVLDNYIKQSSISSNIKRSFDLLLLYFKHNFDFLRFLYE